MLKTPYNVQWTRSSRISTRYPTSPVKPFQRPARYPGTSRDSQIPHHTTPIPTMAGARRGGNPRSRAQRPFNIYRRQHIAGSLAWIHKPGIRRMAFGGQEEFTSSYQTSVHIQFNGENTEGTLQCQASLQTYLTIGSGFTLQSPRGPSKTPNKGIIPPRQDFCSSLLNQASPQYCHSSFRKQGSSFRFQKNSQTDHSGRHQRAKPSESACSSTINQLGVDNLQNPSPFRRQTRSNIVDWGSRTGL